MKHLTLLILLALMPLEVGGHTVIEKQCPECEGMCIPKTGGIVSVTLMACDCCNTVTAGGVCQITGNAFSYTYQECDEVKWIIDYKKIGVLADTTQQQERGVPCGPILRKRMEPNSMHLSMRPNTKYRVNWHEFVPLTKCGWRERGSRWEDVVGTRSLILNLADSIWYCDTIGYRPTVVSYEEIEK